MSNGDFDGGYSQPQQQQQVAPQQDAPPHAQQPGTAHTQPGIRPKSGLLLALSILSGVLLLTTIVFAGTTVWLFSTRSAPAATDHKNDPDAEGEKADKKEGTEVMLGGVPVEVTSDLKFGSFGLSAPDGSRFSSIYATVKNDDKTNAAAVSFDITVYDKKNQILGRTPTHLYLLPGQTSMFYGIVDADITSSASVALEQTRMERSAPAISGGIKIDELGMDDESGYVLGTFTASLTAVPEFPDVFMAAFDGERLIAACYGSPDIPAEGAFESDCILEPLGQEKLSGELKLPKDVEFEVYLALDEPR